MKPLEKAQLKNWRGYLEFEAANGSEKRVVILFERCVIACALYEEFWMKVHEYGLVLVMHFSVKFALILCIRLMRSSWHNCVIELFFCGSCFKNSIWQAVEIDMAHCWWSVLHPKAV